MRRAVLPAVAALLLAPVAAGAAPVKAGCRPVVTDPRGDTRLVQEPGADLLAVSLRSDAKDVTIAVTLADVDAPVTTSPLGRSVWVAFAAGEQPGFSARWYEGRDTTRAILSVPDVADDTDATSLALSTTAQPLEWSIDTKANALRLKVPLQVLRRYAGSVRKGSSVVVSDAQTYELFGTSEANTGGSIDLTTFDGARRWRVGDC
jgi:hypothetical protein